MRPCVDLDLDLDVEVDVTFDCDVNVVGSSLTLSRQRMSTWKAVLARSVKGGDKVHVAVKVKVNVNVNLNSYEHLSRARMWGQPL